MGIGRMGIGRMGIGRMRDGQSSTLGVYRKKQGRFDSRVLPRKKLLFDCVEGLVGPDV